MRERQLHNYCASERASDIWPTTITRVYASCIHDLKRKEKYTTLDKENWRTKWAAIDGANCCREDYKHEICFAERIYTMWTRFQTIAPGSPILRSTTSFYCLSRKTNQHSTTKFHPQNRGNLYVAKVMGSNSKYF